MTSSLENSRLDSVFGSSSPEEARKHAQTLRVARETGEPVPRVGGTMAMQLYTDTITNPYIGWDDEIGNGFFDDPFNPEGFMQRFEAPTKNVSYPLDALDPLSSDPNNPDSNDPSVMQEYNNYSNTSGPRMEYAKKRLEVFNRRKSSNAIIRKAQGGKMGRSTKGRAFLIKDRRGRGAPATYSAD